MTSSGVEFHVPVVAGMLPESAVAALVDHAVKLPASDLFITPNENHVAVSVRHLGLVRLLTILPSEMGRLHEPYQGRSGHGPRRTTTSPGWSLGPGLGGKQRIRRPPNQHHTHPLRRRLLAPYPEPDPQVQSVEHLGLPRRDMNELLSMLASPVA